LYVDAAAESKDRGRKKVDTRPFGCAQGRQLKVEGSIRDGHGPSKLGVNVPCPYGMGSAHHQKYIAQPGLAVPPWDGDERC